MWRFVLILSVFCGVAVPTVVGETVAAEFSNQPIGQSPALRSESALVVDDKGRVLFAKQATTVRPIASLTKLMTAIVTLDHGFDLEESIEILAADRDQILRTGSRLNLGSVLSRRELLELALMASENRAANALARTFPGGSDAFIAAMNNTATRLGMHVTRFTDPAGLDAGNVSTAMDLLVLLNTAGNYPLIREATTRESMQIIAGPQRGRLNYVNTNRLLQNTNWDIRLGKTGYTNAAGRCFVMRARVGSEELSVILLDSFGKLTPFGDSNRILNWLRRQPIA